MTKKALQSAERKFDRQAVRFANCMLPWYESAMREATPLSGEGDSGAVSPSPENRRPIRLRDARWAQVTASFLARLGVRPNQISCASTLASGVGAVSLYFFPQS
jgi:hypothetical protein